MNSGFSRSLIGQIDWHIIYELVEALPLIYLFIIIIFIIVIIIIIIIIIFNITLIYFTWLSQLFFFFFLPSVNLIETAKNKNKMTKKQKNPATLVFRISNLSLIK